jgi:hypothetical protein
VTGSPVAQDPSAGGLDAQRDVTAVRQALFRHGTADEIAPLPGNGYGPPNRDSGGALNLLQKRRHQSVPIDQSSHAPVCGFRDPAVTVGRLQFFDLNIDSPAAHLHGGVTEKPAVFVHL